MKKQNRTLVLALLTIVYCFNFLDRQIVGILAPFIQADLELTNTQLGLILGPAFVFLYVIVGIPVAWLADRYNRISIVSFSLAFYSFFTVATGMAGNFTQMFLARIGVGIGEAGGSPPSHSVISDLYAKEERTSALSIYSLGIPIGIMAAYLASASLLGADVDAVNWRRIFVILGVSGVILALIVRLIVREPLRGAMENSALNEKTMAKEKLPFFASLKILLTIKSWWFMCLGIAFASFAAYAFSGFQTKFIRLLSPEADFRLVLIVIGVINGLVYAAGTFMGGRISDKLAKKSVRAYGLVPFFAIAIGVPLAWLCFWTGSVWTHLIVATPLMFCLGIYLGPSFAIAQTLSPIHIRAMSTALFFFILNLVSLGGGPTTAGILIDAFGQTDSELLSIRKAMTIVFGAGLVAAFFFFLASRTLPKDWAIAEARNEG